jgi:hypothetical protein
MACFLFLGVGCMSSARFVERTPNGGTVAVPDYAHRGDGLDLIHHEIGPNYAIVDEKEVLIGTDTKVVATAGTGSIFTRIAAWFNGTKQVAKSETRTEQEKEFRITYVTTPPALPQPPPPNP